MLTNYIKLSEEALPMRDSQQIERFDLLVHGLNLQAYINIEQLTASNLFNVAPSQDKLLFLAQDGLLLDVDVVRRCFQTERHKQEVFLRDEDISPER